MLPLAALFVTTVLVGPARVEPEPVATAPAEAADLRAPRWPAGAMGTAAPIHPSLGLRDPFRGLQRVAASTVAPTVVPPTAVTDAPQTPRPSGATAPAPVVVLPVLRTPFRSRRAPAVPTPDAPSSDGLRSPFVRD